MGGWGHHRIALISDYIQASAHVHAEFDPLPLKVLRLASLSYRNAARSWWQRLDEYGCHLMLPAHSMNGQDDMSKTGKIRQLDEITHCRRCGKLMMRGNAASYLFGTEWPIPRRSNGVLSAWRASSFAAPL
jgi:hypothetical protein